MKLQGVAEWMAAVEGMVDAMDAAARRSVAQAALLEKRKVRAKIGGPARWVHGVNYPRGGGPAVITGKLQRSVSYKPVRRLGYGHYATELKAKRIYASNVERLYPYFAPAVRESEGDVERIFERNYLAALESAL